MTHLTITLTVKKVGLIVTVKTTDRILKLNIDIHVTVIKNSFVTKARNFI